MLLETLDILHNDVIIYSVNKFDFKDNFKIIFKNEEIKRPREIDYFEVCKFLRDPAPKNLIVYRLLTSMSQLDAFSTKFGYFINTNQKLELIYFDPVFAIKDLENLRLNSIPSEFRFKIQQVGFRTVSSKDNESIYSEVYSFDLRAVEAQNQNDRIFAQAIFALDDSFVDDMEDQLDSDYGRKEIVEVDQNLSMQFNKARIIAPQNSSDANTSKIEKLKQSFALNWESDFKAYNAFRSAGEKVNVKKEGITFSEFIEKQRNKDEDKGFLEDKFSFSNSDRDPVILRFKD